MKAYRVLALVLVVLLLAVGLAAPKDAACIYCGPCAGDCPFVTASMVQLHAKTAPYQGLPMMVQASTWTTWCVAEWSGDGHFVVKLIEGPWAGYYVDVKDAPKPPPPPGEEDGAVQPHPDWWHCEATGTDGYKLPNNCWPQPAGAWGVWGTVGPTSSCLGRTYRQINSGMWSGWWVPASAVSCHWHD